MDGIAWADLTVSDAEGLKDFYSDVVGGAVEAVDMGGYSDFNLCDASGQDPQGAVIALAESRILSEEP